MLRKRGYLQLLKQLDSETSRDVYTLLRDLDFIYFSVFILWKFKCDMFIFLRTFGGKWEEQIDGQCSQTFNRLDLTGA